MDRRRCPAVIVDSVAKPAGIDLETPRPMAATTAAMMSELLDVPCGFA